MIQWFQSRNIHKTGTYWPPALSAFPYIEINILDQAPSFNETGFGQTIEDKKIASFKFHEVHFLDASEVTFSYADNTPISYSITFNSNYYTYENF